MLFALVLCSIVSIFNSPSKHQAQLHLWVNANALFDVTKISEALSTLSKDPHTHTHTHNWHNSTHCTTAVSTEKMRRMQREAHVALTKISCHRQTGRPRRQRVPLRCRVQTGWFACLVWILLPSSFALGLSLGVDVPGTPCQPWSVLNCQTNFREICWRRQRGQNSPLVLFFKSLERKLRGVTDFQEISSVWQDKSANTFSVNL